MARQPICQAKTIAAPGYFHASAKRVPGIGRQPDRVMISWRHITLDDPRAVGASIVGNHFVYETTALISADAGGLPGREICSQTIHDLELFGIGVRAGPRVALVDRVELNHAEYPS